MISSLNHVNLKNRLGGRNLYLIGMMGSGKTSTGPHLAKEINYRFVDADAILEQAAGKSIHEIFRNNGQDEFRNLESQVLTEIGQHHSLVVATGGGVVTRSENWGILHQGIVIWLDPGAERLYKRLKSDTTERPLLNKLNSFELFQSLYKEREPLYKESDLHIFINDETPSEVGLKIIDLLPSILHHSEDPS